MADSSGAFDRDIHRAVGLSDMAALLAAAFRFPEGAGLGDALADGSFLSDWAASVEDACGRVGSEDDRLVRQCRLAFQGASSEALRREYSRLFLVPGPDVPIWPYESCFLHREAGRRGTPSLFRSRVSLEVERLMAEAGVAPATARTEPVDSVHLEFDFLSFLYLRRGDALERKRGGCASDDSDAWADRIESFATGHALAWLPAFMRQVKGRARLAAYAHLGDLGLRYMSELEADARLFAAARKGR